MFHAGIELDEDVRTLSISFLGISLNPVDGRFESAHRGWSTGTTPVEDRDTREQVRYMSRDTMTSADHADMTCSALRALHSTSMSSWAT